MFDIFLLTLTPSIFHLSLSYKYVFECRKYRLNLCDRSSQNITALYWLSYGLHKTECRHHCGYCLGCNFVEREKFIFFCSYWIFPYSKIRWLTRWLQGQKYFFHNRIRIIICLHLYWLKAVYIGGVLIGHAFTENIYYMV